MNNLLFAFFTLYVVFKATSALKDVDNPQVVNRLAQRSLENDAVSSENYISVIDNEEVAQPNLLSGITWEQIQEEGLDHVHFNGHPSGRRNLLDKPDSYYEQCVYWINAMRAKEGLPALKRWTEFEQCSDEMSTYDAEVNGEGSITRPHAASADGIGCDFQSSGMRSWAQNTCPWWPDSEDSLEKCNIAMWQEKYYPGVVVDGDRLAPKPGFSTGSVGHYYNMRGGSSGYNNYDRVACGFHTANDGSIWINMNFGGPQEKEFECGGNEDTHPSDLLVDDCTSRGNYEDCTETNINYDIPGCEWTHECYYKGAETCQDSSTTWNFGTQSCQDYPGDFGCFLASFTLTRCPESCNSCKCASIRDDTLTCVACEEPTCGSCQTGETCVISEQTCLQCPTATCSTCASDADCSSCEYCSVGNGCLPKELGAPCNDDNDGTYNDMCTANSVCQGESFPQTFCIQTFSSETDFYRVGDWAYAGDHNGKPYWDKVQANPDSQYAIWWHTSNQWYMGPNDDMDFIWVNSKCVDSTQPASPADCVNWDQYGSSGWTSLTPAIEHGACACDNWFGCPSQSGCSSQWYWSVLCRETCDTCYSPPSEVTEIGPPSLIPTHAPTQEPTPTYVPTQEPTPAADTPCQSFEATEECTKCKCSGRQRKFSLSLQECTNKAVELGMDYFSYMASKEKCQIPRNDDTNQCVTNRATAGNKWAVFSLGCADM